MLFPSCICVCKCGGAHVYKYACPCTYGGWRQPRILSSRNCLPGFAHVISHWNLRLSDWLDTVDKNWIYLHSPPQNRCCRDLPPCMAFSHGCWRQNTGPHVRVLSTLLAVPPPQPISPFVRTTLDVPYTLAERGKIILDANTPGLVIWRSLEEKTHLVLDFWSPVWCSESAGSYEQWQWGTNMHKFSPLRSV